VDGSENRKVVCLALLEAPGIQSRQYGAQHAKNKGHVPWMDRKTERLFAWLGVTFLEWLDLKVVSTPRLSNG